MSWNNRIKAARFGYILSSIALCILGAVLIAVPGFSALLLCRIGGIIMIAFGLAKIVGYLSRDLYRLAFQFDLACGILLIALGGILIFQTAPMIAILSVVLGIYVLADALLKIQVAIDAKAFGLKKWWLILSCAVLTGIAGFLLIFRPTQSAQALMLLLGLTLITEGMLNLITILTAVKIIRRKQPEIIDEDDIERWEES